MMDDTVYMIVSEDIPDLIDRALEAGGDFDAILKEIRAQCDIAESNRFEYEERP